MGERSRVCQVLHENRPMLALAERLDFERAPAPEPGIAEVVLELQGGA